MKQVWNNVQLSMHNVKWKHIGMTMLAFKFAGLVYLASVKKKFAAKCTIRHGGQEHSIFFNELIKQQTVLLAEWIEGAQCSGVIAGQLTIKNLQWTIEDKLS